MSKAKQIKPMQVWAILDPERYIKKSIKDWSLAIYDEKASADRRIESISIANNEECFIEELALCNKVKLDEYVEAHNEMYALLELIMKNNPGTPLSLKINRLLSKARGEHDNN